MHFKSTFFSNIAYIYNKKVKQCIQRKYQNANIFLHELLSKPCRVWISCGLLPDNKIALIQVLPAENIIKKTL